MTAPVLSVGDAAAGNVSCAVLGKSKLLVKLEGPTERFLEKCQAGDINDGAKQCPERPPRPPKQGQRDSAPSSSSFSSAQVRDPQEAGLLLLAEEAEMQDAMDDEGAGVDENIQEDSDADDDLHIYVGRGLAAACHPHLCTSDAAIEDSRKELLLLSGLKLVRMW